ncbi:MAG: hypothetical protein GY850_10310, partial [bacterium]|nr:hypothetical protein [bacterium]
MTHAEMLDELERLRNYIELLEQTESSRKRVEDALRYRVEFVQLITDISTGFINLMPEQIDDRINLALQEIGCF